MHAPGNSVVGRFFEPLVLWKRSAKRDPEQAARAESSGHVDVTSRRIVSFASDVVVGTAMFALLILPTTGFHHLVLLRLDQPLKSLTLYAERVVVGIDVVLFAAFLLKSIWGVLRQE